MKPTSESTLATRPRPDSGRPLEAPYLSFDLSSLSERIKTEEDWAINKHNAITLVKNDGIRIVLMAMQKGKRIKMHLPGGELCVHVLEGQLTIYRENEAIVLNKGQLLALQEHIRYEWVAVDETTCLLTMTNVFSYVGRIF